MISLLIIFNINCQGLDSKPDYLVKAHILIQFPHRAGFIGLICSNMQSLCKKFFGISIKQQTNIRHIGKLYNLFLMIWPTKLIKHFNNQSIELWISLCL